MNKLLTKLKCIDSLSRDDLKGKRVLVRTDFNVPISQSGRVNKSDGWRIDRAMDTIDFLVEKKAIVILISHIGRGKEESLRPVFDYLSKKLQLGFIPQNQKEKTKEIVEEMKEGGILLLENLRKDPREINNDKNLAKELAGLADIFVNEAFSVSHREHASVVQIPKLLPSYIGLNFKAEIEYLSKFENPERPFGLILGGAKLKTKLPLIKNFIDRIDWMILGGGIANTMLKEMGYEIGRSIFEEGSGIKEYIGNKKIFLPEFYITNTKNEIKRPNEIKKEDKILDIAPGSFNPLENKIQNSKTILWNGPLGLYEDGFVDGSVKLAKIINGGNAISIAGGGDTVKLLYDNDFGSGFSFLSTGGGAMLEFLVNPELPGIKAIM